MTEKAIDALKATVQRDQIATYRYMAFLEVERRALVHELHPEHQPGDLVFFPVDSQVSNLVYDIPPMGSAVTVLEALGMDPYAEDRWIGTIGINPKDVPFGGVVK